MNYRNLLLISIVLLLVSCGDKNGVEIFIPKNIVIAHRGSTYFTPEETEAAYRWARNMGSDYLEVDIQRSKDGVLLALHDVLLTRTTNVEKLYPNRKEFPASEFNFDELMLLDAGSWFNKLYPDRGKIEFQEDAPVYKSKQFAVSIDKDGKKLEYIRSKEEVYYGGKQYVLTLEDVVRIAEGYRIAKDSLGNRLYEKHQKNGTIEYTFYYVKDNADSGDRPGVYIETKRSELFPNIEIDLFNELDRLGWNNVTKPTRDTMTYDNGKVRIAKTSAKIILQTFSVKSLENLYKEFEGKVPMCFLLWLGDPNMLVNDSLTYLKNLMIAKENGAKIIGPSIGGGMNNYKSLLTSENYRWIKSHDFLIHPYSFDTFEQMTDYGDRSDGMFTNRADLTKVYYKKNNSR